MILRKVYKILKPYRKFYFIALLATIVSVVISLINPLIISFTVDYVLTGETVDNTKFVVRALTYFQQLDFFMNNIWACAFLLVVFAAVSGIFTFVRGYFSAYAAESIATDQKNRLYDHLQKLPYDYHVKAQTGDLIQRCTTDVDTVRKFLSSQLIEVFRILFVAVVAFLILLNLNFKLALITVIFIPFIFISTVYFSNKIRELFNAVEIKEGELSTVLQENLTGVRVVRAFGREVHELEKFQEKSFAFKDSSYKAIRFLAKFWGASDFTCFLQIGLVKIAGIYMVYNGTISVGTLLVFILYVNNLVWPLRQLGRILSQYARMEVALERINDILITKEEEETENAVEADLSGDIVFDKVTFGYEKNKPVLKDISFTVKGGETIAILGSTGSGKSSLLHLLLRLYDYKEGSVKIGGTELKHIKKQHLRAKIGMVLQDPFLYSKTIMRNIKMAKDHVEEHEVYDAAKISNVHHVIEGFNDKYETMVGERGVTLSGGQKQRVAIARTLVKNSQILIFDDSLSAVDTQTDKAIRDALKQKSTGVTTFIISQRITTLMDADKIFVMENGRITDMGTHEELIKREGLYKRIWDIQNILESDLEEEIGNVSEATPSLS